MASIPDTVGSTRFVGLAIPVGVTARGRARLASGDEQLIKIIGLHLSMSDSDNPFQDIGIDQVIFNLNGDLRLLGLIRYRLTLLFDGLEADERARLKEDTVEFVSDEGTGELELAFQFVNLRTNQGGTFRGRVDRVAGRVIPV